MSVNLQPLYQALIGAQGSSTPDTSWQTELLKTVNPEEQRRQNIRKALATASQTLATTPGNFLQGLAAATSTGANSYIQGQDQNQDNRVKVLQAIQQANQSQQDQRMKQLAALIGAGRDINADERQGQQIANAQSNADRDYNLRVQNSDNLNDWRNDKLSIERTKASIKASSGGNLERERRLTLDSINNRVSQYEKMLNDQAIDPDTITQKVGTYKKQLGDAYRIDPDTGRFTDGRDDGNSTSPSFEDTKTINGKTYVKQNGQWFEQQ